MPRRVVESAVNRVSSSLQGRQEDAEEYLGFTLNGLHEEMLALKKLISPPDESAFTFPVL